VVDTARIAVGGHSYGAFMSANLLVCASLHHVLHLGCVLTRYMNLFQRAHASSSCESAWKEE